MGRADGGEEVDFAPPVHERLGEIQVPVLLIAVDLDQPDILASVDRLATGILWAE